MASSGLLILGAVLAAVYALRFAAEGPGAVKSAVKTGAVLALAGAAALAGAPGAIVAGLVLGAAGDFALSRPGERAFLAGMAAFAGGHLAYLAAFWAQGVAWPGAGPVILLYSFGGAVERWVAPRAGALKWPVRGYILVILAMAGAAAGLDGAPMLVAGAALFVVSDLLLAIETFGLAPAAPRYPLLRAVVARLLWGLYWGGQALIGLGAVG
ncbi:hypothetical protein LPB142_11235 [Rhodobacter xanthinilyticus]|uniref:Lysoplasmalogenase n=1 Tax=Rhodobacter xanthinilyticus TaxID=1850250 RepID=A0A1D9MDE2_9RHOB|nr:lysoplasmalogenase [Rhodobacter xanthinilyticus]AOZ69823.1 hypothetical protein LPB142_11235 [Rhodobacter xanthinilyticus]